MNVSSNLGEFEFFSIDEFERLIRRAEIRELWLSHDSSSPCLAMLLKDGNATLTFFYTSENYCQSIGDISNKEETVFLMNNEITVVPAFTVVPCNTAIESALEFYMTNYIPQNILWTETEQPLEQEGGYL